MRTLFVRHYLRRAFTLVELLVVLAIVGLLVALLLPAVQMARESARKSQCGNNLKQIGLALHGHLDQHKRLPAGYTSGELPDGDDAGPGWSWAARLMPFIEQQALHDQIVFEAPVESVLMEDVRLASVESFVCPSDGLFVPIVDIPEKLTHRVICPMAGASYVGSAGTVRVTCKVCRDRFDGVFGRNRPIGLREITDGLSKTIAVGERSGFWSNPALWGVVPKSIILDHQQEGKYAAGPGYVLGTTFKDGFNIESIPLDINEELTFAESYGSQHPGGSHFTFCDGGVRFVWKDTEAGIMNTISTRGGMLKDGRDDPVVHASPF